MFRNIILTTALALVLASPAAADSNTLRELPGDPTAPQGPPAQASALTAEAWFDRANATYALGEAVKIFVRTNEDAYVTALSIGPTGNVTQIFPNAFHPNNLVQAHQPIEIPGPGAQAVVTGALGPETIKIIATSRPFQVIPEDQLGAAPPFRSVVGGVDAIARDLKTVAAQPEQELMVLDKTFLSVPPAPGAGYPYSAQTSAPTYTYPAPAYEYPGPAYGYSAPAYGYSAPAYGYSAPGYGYPAPAYGYPAQTYGYPAQTYGYPAQAYDYPAQAYDYPAPAYGYPAPAYGYPAQGYGYPAQGYGYPAQGYVYAPPASVGSYFYPLPEVAH